jgi:succinate dehydrogenase/fumarate reductase flavoprotein subunit
MPFDAIVVGGSFAGLSAAIYIAREIASQRPRMASSVRMETTRG